MTIAQRCDFYSKYMPLDYRKNARRKTKSQLTLSSGKIKKSQLSIKF